VAVLVLRPWRAEVHADAPVEELHLGLAVGAALDAAQPHESAPVDQLALDAREPGRERRQREVVAAEPQHVVGLGERVAERRVELLPLVGVEDFGPRRLVGDVGGRPLALRLEDPGLVCHRASG
jgi:hypothetical protein